MAGRRSTGAAHDGPRPAHDRAGGGDDGPGTGHDGPGAAIDGPGAGDVVAGVRLSALVGKGGEGTVWSGTEIATGARVAVKLVPGAGLAREAGLLTAVRHPHVLSLRRISTDPPALVTDLAAGGSLAAQVEARGSLEPGEVVTVLAPLADALAALHAQGVVHGDVTAANVLFVDRGRPVLADLGVAGLAGDGVAWATPGYAAPEVLAGTPPGPAGDVHGLGAAAWLALTGSVPPVHDDRLPLRLLAPECPAGLADAVTAALDPDPARRPTPGELAAAARASCPGLAVRLVPAAARGVRPDEAVTSRVREAAAADHGDGVGRGWRRRLRAGRYRRRALVAGGAGALGTALAVAVGLVVSGGVVTGPAPGAAGPPAVEVRAVGPAGAGGAAGAAGSVDPGGVESPDDLRAVVTGLVEARERALRAGDAAALQQVHDPEGATLAADRALVGGGPIDVSYEVVRVRSVPGRPDAADVALRTTSDGVTVAEAVVIEMASGPDGWRVVSVEG